MTTLARRALTVGAILRAAPADLADVLTPGSVQAKAWRDLRACRTAADGGHLVRCTTCAHEHPGYNSCCNRHCPTCQPYTQAKWIAGRLERVLHFHLVFTLPAELRGLAYAHKRAVYDPLFAAASATLARMSADKLGGTPGVTLVLHTWTRTLGYHPHLHAIVTGGALSTDGARWKPARQAWLFPVAELAARFRGAFLAALRASPLATDAVLDLVRRLYRRRLPLSTRSIMTNLREVFLSVSTLPYPGSQVAHVYPCAICAARRASVHRKHSAFTLDRKSPHSGLL